MPKPDQFSGQEGGGVETKDYLSKPENYILPTTYPRYEVANISHGAGTFTEQLAGSRFYFKSEKEANAYIESQRQLGFKGNIEITIWDDERDGRVISHMEVK